MDMAALFADISVGLSGQFGGPYHAATLIAQGPPTTNAGGEITGTSATTERSCMAMVDNATEAMRAEDGYTDEDRRILVLASGISGISTDETLTITAGQFAGEWLIGSVARDPFDAYFEIRGRRA